jgi:adenylate kinase family enzyme
MVVGSGGSGKSALAPVLGRHTGLSVMHLDSHYWQPGWRATPSAVWRTKVRELVAEPAWVMDGNYISTLDLMSGPCSAAS